MGDSSPIIAVVFLVSSFNPTLRSVSLYLLFVLLVDYSIKEIIERADDTLIIYLFVLDEFVEDWSFSSHISRGWRTMPDPCMELYNLYGSL